ncbi:MAG: 2-C-methyl-D-erythritol 2,4-cyclodiphosphate synthase [Melioribacteraceae bacterium]|nr:2-C-methyl-D-erythritol 2,4-cyclodiphosphate synthase [Melioribacteraceae bacterium]MCF8356382.1 2-C-methyl-D-erythritol 2,4-cyclodiphosphate synthase [Melioribacteraceae bacterium]MCF8395765.1 2-C-methyl-D-erythritol 2,4-cyclodiphosphate synthase [Melioribacteraceae bacterium]MCF8420892.1 2-C-methyl-D-erythritol 2,4-cyclodiphosphate synthase [Melioribacteraceae bacterium]
MSNKFRIGFGYDVHAFGDNRKLFLGGVEIPFEKGLAGHSDADVLLHAICDALLGALALGDIGQHFPNTAEEFKDIDSKVLLKKTYELVREKGYSLGNLDSTIILQRPKIMPYADKIRSTIAELIDCEIDQVSVKATTAENLGFVGEEEGAEAYATVLLFEIGS